ncbi:hypothetical protein [Sphingobium sp. SA916]|uniref:hypothetical protein n=1 Tax=Sphingobium sp. SA916 TaxID=1851207 RepID=UPI000C9FF4B4|nr:hypothetical protein [Sphingobium sp. SA916]PNQ04032.1 hypothetical protein A8G00_09145 [Sphingobium sp. SA916]
MADRASVTMSIGGVLPSDLIGALCAAIRHDGACRDWDSGPFVDEDIVGGEALFLCGHEIAWGMFEALETFCQAHSLPFARWSGSCRNSFGPERVVYDGTSDPRHFLATDDDEILFSIEDIRRLGTIDAIEAHYAFAHMIVGPLTIDPTPPAHKG